MRGLEARFCVPCGFGQATELSDLSSFLFISMSFLLHFSPCHYLFTGDGVFCVAVADLKLHCSAQVGHLTDLRHHAQLALSLNR